MLISLYSLGTAEMGRGALIPDPDPEELFRITTPPPLREEEEEHDSGDSPRPESAPEW